MIHTPTNNQRKINFVVIYFGAPTSSAEEKRDEDQIVAQQWLTLLAEKLKMKAYTSHAYITGSPWWLDEQNQGRYFFN